MPGGVIKGAYWLPPHPAYIERAQDCYLWDLDGTKYVDFANHHTTMVLGHSHPDVVAAVRRQLELGLGPGGPSTLEAETAEEITSRFPSIDKVRFTNSGTESSLHVTRMARALSGKPKVAKFEGAYHGSHDALEVSVFPPLDRAGPHDSPSPVAGQIGMSRTSQEDAVILPYNQPESVELILREHQGDVGAVFYDGKPGLLDIPADFTHFLRDITRELGILLVMDEVVSFRAGYRGYQGLVGVEPDLTMFGKAMGGGFPVGVIGGRADLMDLLDATTGESSLGQSGSFSGNSFTLAAGLATLRALTPEVFDRVSGTRARLQTGLEDVFRRAGVPGEVLGEGAAASYYFTDQPVRDYRSFAALHDSALAERVSLSLFLRGYNERGGIGLTISAPLTNEHVDGFLDAMEGVLAEED
jgi:glutamate-1-semialdehyde 2,1-aminomutase